MVDPGGKGVHPDVARAVNSASAMLADAGYVIEVREAPLLQRVSEIYVQIMSRFGRTSAEPERAPVGHGLGRIRPVLGDVSPILGTGVGRIHA